MEENIRKVSKIRISTYKDSAVKRGRIHRFAKWCSKKYGISWRGIYETFRGSNTSLWKWEGMESCVREFDPRHRGKVGKVWDSCVRNRFVDFMATKGMSRMTVWKRFTADDWNRIELKGIRATYEWWLENVELKNME